MTKPNSKSDDEQRNNYMTPLSVDIRKIVKPLLGKKGFGEFDILSSWEEIVGEKIASFSYPLKLSFPKGERTKGVLRIMVKGGAFALELSHRKALILDKVNTFFGYQAVEDIKISQSLSAFSNILDEDIPKDSDIPLPSNYQAIINEADDADLQASLAKLAKAIISS